MKAHVPGVPPLNSRRIRRAAIAALAGLPLMRAPSRADAFADLMRAGFKEIAASAADAPAIPPSAEASSACDARAAARSFADGAGTPASPFGICTAGQFRRMEQDPRASYQLLADIDLGPSAGAGKGWMPLFTKEPFSGSLDGSGHTIRGLAIARPDEDHVALIRSCAGCAIKNLSLADVRIQGREYSAGLVGSYLVASDYDAKTAGTNRMGNISVSGTVSGTAGAGGVFGYVYNVFPRLSDAGFKKKGVRFAGTVTDARGDGARLGGSYDYD